MRSTEMILKDFLGRQPQEIQERLVQFLPQSQRERLLELPSFSEPPQIESEHTLDRVHWSWFVPMLRAYSPHEVSFFLASIDPRAALALSAEIPCKMPKEKLEGFNRDYFREVLLNHLLGSHHKLLPIAFLPPTPLNRLLHLTKPSLLELVDLLAIHDLAAEIRQIVETKILKKLYSFLTDGQRESLKAIASKVEPPLLPKMGLDRWDATKASLQAILHKRGLVRLGLSLSKQSSSLVWYLSHQLDIGRGSALQKAAKEAPSHGAEIAVKQVVELLDRS